MMPPRPRPPQTPVSSCGSGHHVPDVIAHDQRHDETRSESNYSRPSSQQSITTIATAPSQSHIQPTKADQRPTRARTSDYKPTALRWWYHVILIVCLAVLIGLTEYAMRILNVHQDGIDDFVTSQSASKRSNTHNSRPFMWANAQPRSEIVEVIAYPGAGDGARLGGGAYMPVGLLTITLNENKRNLAVSATIHAQETKVPLRSRGSGPSRTWGDEEASATWYRTVTAPLTESAQPTGVQVQPRTADDSLFKDASPDFFLDPTEKTATVVLENIGIKRTMAAAPTIETLEVTWAEVPQSLTSVPVAVPAMLKPISWLQIGQGTIIRERQDESATASPSGYAESTISRSFYSSRMTYATISTPRGTPEVSSRDESLLESVLDAVAPTTAADLPTVVEDQGKGSSLFATPSATDPFDHAFEGASPEDTYMKTGETTYLYRIPRALQTAAAGPSQSLQQNLIVDIVATDYPELDGVADSRPLSHASKRTSSFSDSTGDDMAQFASYLSIGQETVKGTVMNVVRDAGSNESMDDDEAIESISGDIQLLPISTEATKLQKRDSYTPLSALTSTGDTETLPGVKLSGSYMSPGKVPVPVEEPFQKKRVTQPTSIFAGSYMEKSTEYMPLGETKVKVYELLRKKRVIQSMPTNEVDTSMSVETPPWEQYVSDGMIATPGASPASPSLPSSFASGPETISTSDMKGEQPSPTPTYDSPWTTEHGNHGPFVMASASGPLSTESSFGGQSPEGKVTQSASEATSTDVPFFGPFFSDGPTQIPITQHNSLVQTKIGTDDAPSSSPAVLTMNGQTTSFTMTTEADPLSTATAISPSFLSNSKASTESGRPLSSSVGSRTSGLLTVSPVTVTGGSISFTSTYTDSQGNVETKTYLVASSMSRTANTSLPSATPTSSLKPGNSSVPHAGVGGGGNVTTSSQVVTVVYGVTLKEYVVGAMLPTVIAVLIAFPIKLIGINARLMQPFHALATSDKTGGSRPEASIFLRFYAWSGLTSFLRAIWCGQPIVAISDLLVLGSALLAPLAAETITIYDAIDSCVYACKGNLGSSIVSGRVLQGLLGAMIALLLALVILLSIRPWKTGVSQNPWSIAGMASLCHDPEIRAVIRTMRPGKESAILQLLGKSRYGLGDPKHQPDSDSSNGRYGVLVTGRADAPGQSTGATDTCREYWEESRPMNAKNNKQPFMLLTWWGRCVMLFIFASILIIVVYYQATSGNTGFERFMDSQSYGVKFFFTALGVILGYCMETIFRCVAIMSPYLRLRDEALIAERSIILSPPTNAFYGIWSAYKQRHVFFGFLSFVTLLAELGLPVTLSHVPYSAMETYMTAIVCMWLTTAILGLMIISIVWSFFVKWPHMPVDPRTIAGSLFYVCDSWMLESLEGMSTLSKEARNRSVRFMGHRYGFGSIHGMSDTNRVGVDIVQEKDEELAGGAVAGREPQPQYVWVL